MTVQYAANLVAAFIGGSLVATLISIWAQSRAARIAAERQHLDQAIRQLYGPVVWLLVDIETLLQLNRKVSDASDDHFKQRFSESARETVAQEIKATIETGNRYVRKIPQNIDQIIETVTSAWHLIDTDDVDVFVDIRRERLRMQVEYEAPERGEMPFEVVIALKGPSYYKPEWLAKIRETFDRKVARYRRLSGMTSAGEQGTPTTQDSNAGRSTP